MSEKTFGVCIICGGVIRIGFNGYYCKNCGIHYDKLPNEEARIAVERRFLMMTPQKRKRILQTLDRAERRINKKH
jgi:tRNA(Ile2) C34 agmatinyltransferase TiaS